MAKATELEIGDKVVFSENYYSGPKDGTFEEGTTGVVAKVELDHGHHDYSLVWVHTSDDREAICFPTRLTRLSDVAPSTNFSPGREPSTGEQVLSRARTWMRDNGLGNEALNTQNVLEVARFLDYVDRQNGYDTA